MKLVQLACRSLHCRYGVIIACHFTAAALSGHTALALKLNGS